MNQYRPVLNVDCPDPDVIRVDDKYYMLSTSMFYLPGCEILVSKDLINWKHETFVFDRLDGTDSQKLDNGNIYSAGMWAASLRYHNGLFYICFVANDTHKTYLYKSEDIKGPWIKSEIEGFYHDNSLLFDDDGRIFIAYGNRDIYITELKEDLSAPKPGGFHKLVVHDGLNNALGYEGTHFYKINGEYYLFFIHSIEGRCYRTQSCYRSKTLDGEFTGQEIFADDNGYRDSGIAQGAIVDTQSNEWYALLFQDRGGSGRIPYLIPMKWEEGWPVIGDKGKLPSLSDSVRYDGNTVLYGSDDFKTFIKEDSCFGFSNIWQFNHEPDMALVSRNLDEGLVIITTDKICTNPTEAKNSLTQRMCEPACEAIITIDTSRLQEGDFAGMSAFQYLYGFIGVRVDGDENTIVYMEKPDADTYDRIIELEKTKSKLLRFKIRADFMDNEDLSYFSYDIGSGFVEIENTRSMPFMLEFFTGYRFALNVFSTVKTGGSAIFSKFDYTPKLEK